MSLCIPELQASKRAPLQHKRPPTDSTSPPQAHQAFEDIAGFGRPRAAIRGPTCQSEVGLVCLPL
jgi:hypothetical protein